MSTPGTVTPMCMPLIGRMVRAYFAPVNRLNGTPTIFDPSQNPSWNSPPPAPWIDLGWVTGFRRDAESVIDAIDAGIPPAVKVQTRTKIGATVSFAFSHWTKLNMALATDSEHMNLLQPATGALSNGSGAAAATAVPLSPNSSANVLYLASGQASSAYTGSIVVVDQDYTGQIGFVGSAVSGAYVANASAIGNDLDYIRRVSFNVARVISVASDGGLHLANPLVAGVPNTTMKLQQVLGFVDREGGCFFQEWSALFIVEGTQGDRLCFHYPRLQASAPTAEIDTALGTTLQVVQLTAKFRALTVSDSNDGQQVACYRSYIPPRFSFV